MDVLERNFFTDPEVFQDPAPYYTALRRHGPIWREPHFGVFILSGMEEILEVYSDYEHYSAIVSSLGPLIMLPAPDEDETWAEVIERRRDEIPMGNMIVALDPPRHTRERSLAGKLFTPNRLKENEEFMWQLADQLIDEIADRGEVEFGSAFARPFTLLVVADLLGVPRKDHEKFRGWLGRKGNVGDPEGEHAGDQVFANLSPYFTQYIEERRTAPGNDVMSRLATARYPDGELPDVDVVVRLASIFFAAGQETTARLLAAAMRVLAEQPSLADRLRRDATAIPRFVEECLRLEGPIKSTFRLVLKDTRIVGVDVPAGSIVMGLIGAANRDPQVFDDPDRFDSERANARRNIAFGHGEHFCPGASLARAEVRISVERLLARLDSFELVDPSALSYAPTYIIRGLNDLPLRFRNRSRHAQV
jgi:cytochrome P450